MAGTLTERKGSGDFSFGVSGAKGTLLYIAVGYDSQDDVYAAVVGTIPARIGLMFRDNIDVKSQGGGVYYADISYANVKPTRDGGENKSQRKDGNKDVGPEFSFTTGGGTEKIFIARSTEGYARSVNGVAQVAPDPKNIIGLNFDTGEVAGCEVHAKKCEFNITQRYTQLKLGYVANLMEATATTNAAKFYGFDQGEVIFLGGDGHYKSGDKEAPWSISGKFAFAKNIAKYDVCKDGTLIIDNARGWDYLWFAYVQTTQAIGGKDVPISTPKYAYVARVYDESDFDLLEMDIST